MFLKLNHQSLQIFQTSRKFVLLCYKISKLFPPDERFAMTQQVRRAALSVHLNIAEGCSRKSLSERKRFFEISRGSIIEIDAALDVAEGLEYISKEICKDLGTAMVDSFKMLSSMLK